jgi:hypothetical protein
VNGRAILFSMVAPATYTIASYFSWPLLRYYPITGRFSWATETGSGFEILWYGWVAAAVLAGALAAFAVPRRWSDRLPLDLCWMMLLGSLFAALIYEKRWFF